MWYYVEILTKTQDLDQQLFLHVRDKKPLNEFPLIAHSALPTVNVLDHQDFSEYKLAVMVEATEDDILSTARALCEIVGFGVSVRNVFGTVVGEFSYQVTGEKPLSSLMRCYTVELHSSCARLMQALYEELKYIRDLRTLGYAYFTTPEYRDLWISHGLGEVSIESVICSNNRVISITVHCLTKDTAILVRALSTTFGLEASIFEPNNTVAIQHADGVPEIAQILEEMLP